MENKEPVVPSRNVMDFNSLAKAMYGSDTDCEVEVQSLKVMLSAISIVLLDKGILSRVEIYLPMTVVV